MTMRRLTTYLLALIFTWAGGAAAVGQACQDSTRIGDRLIVRMNPGISLDAFISDFAGRHPAIGIDALDQIPGRPIYLLGLQYPPFFPIADIDALETEVATTYPSLAWGEMLYESDTPEGTTGSTLVDRSAPTASYQDQYALQNLGFAAPLKDVAGANPVHLRSTGRGVVVAIIDSGVDATHAELASAFAPGGYDFIDDDADFSDLPDGVDNDQDGLIDEMVGHGTFVAGLVHLVAPDARLLPVRVLDSDGRGTLWTLARGMFHAIDRGVEVINVSIGSTYRSAAVEDAVDNAILMGIPVIAAAGNCNRETPRTYPAMGSGVLGVAAIDADDVRGDFSNFGPRIFISAPGVSDEIAGHPDPARSIVSLVSGNAYGYWEGTSLAAPLVSGVAALVRSQHPEWSPTESTSDLVELILSATSVPIDAMNPAYAEQLGAGRINALAAVEVGPIAPAVGDLDGDGMVGVFDLLKLLSSWGLTHSSADLDGDGIVNVIDLLTILGHWT